jgi:hypothetical protein
MGNAVMAAKKIELPVAMDDVLTRYEKGEQLPDIAKSIGMSERTLYRRLLEDQDRWKAAQQAQAAQRYDFAKAMHAQALSDLNELRQQLDSEGITDGSERKWRLAHVTAKEQAWDRSVRSAQWELERLLKRLYGTDQQVSASHVTINLGGIQRQGATIEHSPGTEDAQVIDSTEGKHSR